MKNFKDIINAWPSRVVFAESLGVNRGVVDKWHLRGSIPAPKWKCLISEAKKYKVKQITPALLVELAAE